MYLQHLQMAEKIGVPGGVSFLKLLEPSSELKAAYVTKILNERNPDIVSQFDNWVVQPAVQHAEQD